MARKNLQHKVKMNKRHSKSKRIKNFDFDNERRAIDDNNGDGYSMSRKFFENFGEIKNHGGDFQLE